MRNVRLLLIIFSLSCIKLQNLCSSTDNWYCFLKYVSIEGKTNFNDFLFTYENKEDTELYKQYEYPVNINDVKLFTFRIPIKNFKGSNVSMQNDFQSLLKASEYPIISVSIQEKQFQEIINNALNELTLDLTIAGISKPVKAQYTTQEHSNNSIFLHGTTHFHLSDFTLEPPEKMLGVIKVEDVVFIRFDIILTNNYS